MITEVQEREFSEWVESIRFVDSSGDVLPVILKPNPDMGEDRED